ncbi:MAG: CHAD domain-containing protein, partial [Rhodospirillales bacterium]|nr:CHAD domain-containing protein [Rhodospirillales bacterium]
RRDRKLRKAGRKLRSLAPQERHLVRIQGKKLRYAAEFFGALYGKSARRTVELLGEIQDALGRLQDVAVARALLRQEATAEGGDRAWAAGLVAGWHAAHAEACLNEAAALWRRYRHGEPFWN